MIFVCLRLFGVLDHNKLPALIALRSDLAAQNLWTAVFCFTYYPSKNDGEIYFH